ncbi:MAG TPA: hypothetical protein VKS22_07285 [Candidatus Binataceae bacterium]|nr:hypothetical protein [Candidatus Binataceae bacterium]
MNFKPPRRRFVCCEFSTKVERGDTIIITRRRRPIARLIPEAARRQDESD